MALRKFHVVDLLCQDKLFTVVISSTWINGPNKCYYPPETGLTKYEFNRLLSNHSSPTNRWAVYKIIHRGSYESLAIAKDMAEYALTHSDINSDSGAVPSQGIVKRVRKPNARYVNQEDHPDDTNDDEPLSQISSKTSVHSHQLSVAPPTPSSLNVAHISLPSNYQQDMGFVSFNNQHESLHQEQQITTDKHQLSEAPLSSCFNSTVALPSTSRDQRPGCTSQPPIQFNHQSTTNIYPTSHQPPLMEHAVASQGNQSTVTSIVNAASSQENQSTVTNIVNASTSQGNHSTVTYNHLSETSLPLFSNSTVSLPSTSYHEQRAVSVDRQSFNIDHQSSTRSLVARTNTDPCVAYVQHMSATPALQTAGQESHFGSVLPTEHRTTHDNGEILKLLRRQQKQIDLLVNGGVLHSHLENSENVFENILPLTTMAKYEDFEKTLEIEERKHELVSFIRTIGGGSAKIAIERGLVQIMKNNVARGINWEGRVRKGSQKVAFRKSNIKEVLFRTIRSIQVYRNTTDAEMELYTKNWLRHSQKRYDTEMARARK